jgi:hypothetical protein
LPSLIVAVLVAGVLVLAVGIGVMYGLGYFAPQITVEGVVLGGTDYGNGDALLILSPLRGGVSPGQGAPLLIRASDAGGFPDNPAFHYLGQGLRVTGRRVPYSGSDDDLRGKQVILVRSPRQFESLSGGPVPARSRAVASPEASEPVARPGRPAGDGPPPEPR